MKGIPSSLLYFPFTEDGTGLRSAAGGAESVRGKERANNIAQATEIPAHNRGRFCSSFLADTEPSLDLGDNECEDITGQVSGELPLHLGIHTSDFKPR